MKSSELMMLAETQAIERGSVVVDQDGTEFVFTGRSFQVLDFESCDKDKYYGLCVDDEWTITDYQVEMED